VSTSSAVLIGRDLYKDYPMNGAAVHALRGVSLEVHSGEYVAIAGPSGSGKSTLLQLIGGVPTPERRNRALELLAYVGLEHRATHRATQLSGGEMQRVAIARAIANRPALLLADEPTGELDAATGGEILSLFRRLNQDHTTLVVITHDEQLAAQAHRVIHMLDGRIRGEP
jgi:ABC-type lipoprotein export system ATPase subunit